MVLKKSVDDKMYETNKYVKDVWFIGLDKQKISA